MAAHSTDALEKGRSDEGAHPRQPAAPARSTQLLILGFTLFVLFIGISRFVRSLSTEARDLPAARAKLLTSGSVWAEHFALTQIEYGNWLSRHAFPSEVNLFNHLSQPVMQSAGDFVSDVPEAEMSFLGRLSLSLHATIIRVAFLLVAGWRLVVVFIVVGVAIGARRLARHTARDLLGQSGNGRAFFAGARAALDRVGPEGAPMDQVTGMACLPAVPRSVALSSDLGKTLESFGALTSTNVALAAILLRHPQWPAYLGTPGSDDLSTTFDGAALPDNALRVLTTALELHRYYCDESEAQASEGVTLPHFAKLEGSTTVAHPHHRLSTDDHCNNLRLALDRVLTDEMKASLAQVDPASVATVILAIEAGRCMNYTLDGGRWIARSHFPQLSARSVLHSIPEFALEYDSELRATLRRALVYASRSGVFAPVPFPVDLRDESRALRQWAEILLSTPDSLQASADEIELLGLSSEIHAHWKKLFFDGAAALDPELLDETYAAPSHVIFMPLSRVIRLLRRITSREIIDRLDELVAVVSQRNRQRASSVAAGASGDDAAAPNYHRIPAPFTPALTRQLKELHGLTDDEIRDWSSLRVVLAANGWLAQRVGDRSVPESSIVFAAFGVDSSVAERNEAGLHGRSGMVPLRSRLLHERWGRNWRSRFIVVNGARISEDIREYQRILAGELEESDDEFGAVG